MRKLSPFAPRSKASLAISTDRSLSIKIRGREEMSLIAWITEHLITTTITGLILLFVPWLLKNYLSQRKEKKKLLSELHDQIEKAEGAIENWGKIDRVDFREQKMNKEEMPKNIAENLKELKERIDSYNEWLRECRNFIEVTVKSYSYELESFKECEKKFKFGIGKFYDFICKYTVDPILMHQLDYTKLIEEIRDKEGRDLKATAPILDAGPAKKGISLKDFLDSDAFHAVIKDLENLQEHLFLNRFREVRKEAIDSIKHSKRLIEKES